MKPQNTQASLTRAVAFAGVALALTLIGLILHFLLWR